MTSIESQGSEQKNSLAVILADVSRSFVEGQIVHKVLDGVTVEFRRGETVALRGRSGSGKSTLLNLISGIDRPDRGRILIDGVDITAMSERDRTLVRRRKIGFVYQAFNLVPTLTVADNIRLVLELNEVPAIDCEARVQTMLESVGLADRLRSYPDVLSGGEQQRVAIARALVHRPTLVLADEPTGNLDDKTAGQVLELLEALVREHGGTMLMATHSPFVAASCDRIIEVRNSNLVESSG